jgi:poly(3-hydroxybutyrate) depolymerase
MAASPRSRSRRLCGAAASASVAMLLAGCDAAPGPADEALPALGLAPAITVSGISAGGYMAGQFHLAHADRVEGAALLAAGPWYCAEGSLQRALGACIGGDEASLDTPARVRQARQLAAEGRLAPPEALAGDRVWVFRGARDDVIAPEVSRGLARFYRELSPTAEVTLSEDVDAVHGWPTVNFGAPCEGFEPPYLTACGFDAAGTLLAALYGELTPPAHADGAALRAFDQREFWPENRAHSLHERGWLFVPAHCGNTPGRCRLHVVFHGCRQSEDFVGEAFVRHTGLNAWAMTNDLVILYPQVGASALRPLNPQGCWDWWGYSGADYAERSGAQVRAVAAMVERLVASPGADSPPSR